MMYLLVAPLAYLLGAIPWGFIVTRLARGIDIRRYGSGRTGMANVLRTAGGRWAAVVAALDVGKGVLAVLVARWLIHTELSEVVAGLLVLAGHNWSVFLKFKAGRGVTVGAGALLVMAPVTFPIVIAVFIAGTLISKYISVGSIVAVLTGLAAYVAFAAAGWYSWTYLWFAATGSAIIIWQHRDNIVRLVRGKERKVGARAEPAPIAGRESG
ncbi:MAG: glycerol-3-phosphate 1-O-acyltransferase PlsY [Chloroflexota bacterium]|nr:glycerol-3-phosphate 1-O-acyltransferase PlsY [Chloroflexota bacterium]